MGLRLTVLGCCGSYPGPGGACSGYLVRGGGVNLWLDAGSGTMANLQRHIGLHEVDAVVLSHAHPDHWSDIEGFRVACAYVVKRDGVPVYAPAGLRERLFPFKQTLDWRTVEDGDRAEVGGLSLRFSRTDHAPETLAVRIEGEGRSLGYSADTGPGWPLSALGEDLDLALCEATYTHRDEGAAQHLSARQAGAAARGAGAARLMITHLWPTVDPDEMRQEATEAFGAPVEVAAMHEEYEI